MTRFVPEFDHPPPPQMLYHAIPGNPEGDYIRTSANYGAEILPEERQKLGMTPDEHTPLVFAATTLGKALAFTSIKGEALFNDTIDSANAEILVACGRDNFMKRQRDATVYALPDTGFVQLPNMQSQSVSTRPVPFSATTAVVKIENANDMMRAGLQIFTFKEDCRTVRESGAEKQLLQSGDKGLATALADAVKSGKLVWENNNRGINPNAALAKQMGIQLKTATKPKSSTPRP